MIKKIAEFLGRKIFIPKAELVETQTTLLQKKAGTYKEAKPEYVGVPAPVETPADPWFTDASVQSIKTEKQITHEEMLEEAARREEENRKEKKEPENIHQKMYEIATKSWNTVAETQGGSENFQEGPGGWCSGNGYNQFRP
jgi:hypothetical protein